MIWKRPAAPQPHPRRVRRTVLPAWCAGILAVVLAGATAPQSAADEAASDEQIREGIAKIVEQCKMPNKCPQTDKEWQTTKDRQAAKERHLRCVFQCALEEAGQQTDFARKEPAIPPSIGSEEGVSLFVQQIFGAPSADRGLLREIPTEATSLPRAYVGPPLLTDQDKEGLEDESAKRKLRRARELDILQSTGLTD